MYWATRFLDLIAPLYARLICGVLRPLHKRVAELLEGRVLDLGSGPAPLVEYYRGYMACLDIGVNMARYAHGRGCDVVVGDATMPPFRSGAFDTAVSVLLLHHLPLGARERLLNEVARLASKYVAAEFRRRNLVNFLFTDMGVWVKGLEKCRPAHRWRFDIDVRVCTSTRD